jgi:hypothetical protein
LYKNQFNPTISKSSDDAQIASLPFEITTDDLPIQAILFEAFMISR